MVYLESLTVPKLNGPSNADLAAWAIELQAALNQANLDKSALRKWAATAKKQPLKSGGRAQ